MSGLIDQIQDVVAVIGLLLFLLCLDSGNGQEQKQQRTKRGQRPRLILREAASARKNRRTALISLNFEVVDGVPHLLQAPPALADFVGAHDGHA